VYLGLDIGSISVNAVTVTDELTIQKETYRRTHGQPVETCLGVLRDLLYETPLDRIAGIAVTGTGGSLIAEILNCFFVNEIIAQSKATSRLYPQVRTVIEMGGEDSKLILLDSGRIADFAMNTVCAAGTGSFLDQQAVRLGINIEDEFGRLALKSTHPPRIAGRCSVFAKSDMIHLQQVATPDHDILMGLCMALARNFKSNVAKGLALQGRVSFQGGVAANRGMVRAFETVLGLKAGDLVIPQHFASMGAVGAVLAMIGAEHVSSFRGPEALEHYLESRTLESRRHAPLTDDGYPTTIEPLPVIGPCPVDAYLGVDVGSISTNLVAIDANRRVIARRYLMTAGRPIEAVRRGLEEIGSEIADRVVIKGVTTTGSGRYLIGDFIGADYVKNEITAHARGAVSVNPGVDTIFEIGGQDSKYISLENGSVVDFTMNKVCAAGTGSFLEEQAEKLGINIKEEFGNRALSSPAPVCLGERCTVFMESSLNHFQQHGLPKDDLVAGLSYSIVLNYLNRVVEHRRVGDTILFQGGTAYNRGVKAAFENVCEKKITVPPHHDVLGALGCALIAQENNPDGPSHFKGFDLARRNYSVESFECTDCPNNCEVRRVSIDGEKPLHYGSRCGKYDEEKRVSLGKDLPDLFKERDKLLFAAHTPARQVPDDAPTVGIPRATLFFELFPFWNAFFTELGFNVVCSSATNRSIINSGCEAVVEEICFPMKVAHGHILELLERGVDYLFLPSVVNLDHLSKESEVSYNCPYVQSLPFLSTAAIDFPKYRATVLRPVIHFEWGRKVFGPQLVALARRLGRRGPGINPAVDAGLTALNSFREKLVEKGRKILAALPVGRPALVIVSRSYNGCDPGLNFRIPDKLKDLGALAIPLDFLPVQENIGPAMKSMYWRNGQRIMSAGRTVAHSPGLNAVYITNFSCGPDSFIAKYFDREMQGKPYLTIELDEHSADAGVITRLEAFLDSLQSGPAPKAPAPIKKFRTIPTNNNKVYIPYMDDHGYGLAAAMRYNGIRAEALPMADRQSVELGQRYTSGKECYPCIITTGDIVKKALSDDFDPDHSSFFMPSSMGPCRFGQYNRFHRMVLDGLGFENVPIVLLDQTVNYEGSLGSLGPGFRRLGWQIVILIDSIKKLLLQTRPYEQSSGDCDAVYSECLDRVAATIEKTGSVGDCAAFSVKRFSSVATNGAGPKPLIGVVGEIYVRSNEFSNDFIIRKIEQLGGEVVMPTLQEWVSYTDWERRKDLKRDGTVGEYAREVLTRFVQDYYVGKTTRPFLGAVKHLLHELPTRKVMNMCARYCHEDIRGEANLSMGRAVEYAQHGCHGLVNVIPFNCMPGTIVNTLLWNFSKDYPQTPVLKMVYDGTAQSGDQTRIEAFMYQARQAMEEA